MEPKDPLLSFKLAGLRAGALVDAAAQDSALVRTAMRLNLWRKRTKLRLKRLFKKATPPTGPLKVLVHIKGGIGDVAMSRVFVKKLRETLPQAEIAFAYDFKSVVETIFPDSLVNRYETVSYNPKTYDLVICGCHFLMYNYIDYKRVERLAPHFLPILQQALSIQQCFRPFERYSPHLDGVLAEIAISHGGSRITNLGWFSGLDIHQNDPAPIALDTKQTNQVLQRLQLSPATYITIHDGINAQTDTSSGYPTRCWPVHYWQALCEQIKKQFPHLKIVQLGGPKSTPFAFVDVSLVGKTSIADLPHILDNSLLHIDGESGIVHLAHLTRVRSVVLFGPSKAAYLGYARNINLSAPSCAGCMNIRPDWMTHCILGKPHEQQCLSQITPSQVFEHVQRLLANPSH